MPQPLTVAIVVGVALGGLLYFLFSELPRRNRPITSGYNTNPPRTHAETKRKPVNQTTCTICMTDFIDNLSQSQPTGQLTCGHKFHVTCIDKWFESISDKICPNCRQAI